MEQIGILSPESDRQHSEIIGSLILLFTSKNFNVNIYFTPSSYSHFYIYDNLTDLKYNKKTVDEFTNEHRNLTWIVSTTPVVSKELLNTIDKKKIIHVLHYMERHKPYMKNIITLTTLILKYNPSLKCQTISTIYQLTQNKHPKHFDKIVCLSIGYMKDYKRLLILSQNKNIVLHIIDKKIDPEDRKKFNNLKNVIIHKKISTQEMVDLIQKCHFIVPIIKMRGYHWENKEKRGIRLCSSIPLAIVFERPLIIRKNIAQEYRIYDSLTFEQNISDVFQSLNTMNQEKYNILVNGMKKTQDLHIKNNLKLDLLAFN